MSYFLVAGCSRSKEYKVIALTAPPETALDHKDASIVCLIHTDQFTVHYPQERSRCNPYRVIVEVEVPDGQSREDAKASAMKKALPLFETVFPSSDGE